MNDNDDAGDVHPLDQDYSEVESREKRQFKLPEGKVLRAGSIIFISGLFLLILTALVLGVFGGSRAVEIGGGYVHVVAMLMILVGGLLMLLGYRIKLAGKMGRYSASWARDWWKVGAFLVANAIAGPVLYVVTEGLEEIFPTPIFRFVVVVFPTAVMVIAAMGSLLHRGWWRGYCVGVLIGMLSRGWLMMNFFGAPFGRSRGGGIFFDAPFFDYVLMIEFCGLLGAGYAMLFEKRGSSASERQLDDRNAG